MISYTAIALSREQRRVLAQSTTIEECRDTIHRHHDEAHAPSKNPAPLAKLPLLWATSFWGLAAMTQDGPSPLTPFQIRYIVETEVTDA